ncbi:MAG: 4-hydroxy-tetrahydrodipicolinate reductase [Acidimicrobiales bacterium]
MIRVGVFGAGGRMGATTCAAIWAAHDLELVAAVDPSHAGAELSEVVAAAGAGAGVGAGVFVTAEPGVMALAGVEVAVDFTVAGAARENLRWCAAHGVHVVVGTTGFNETDIAELRQLFAPGLLANAVVAPNFSIGAVMMMRCAAMCAPYFEGAEIIELHHSGKRDAPSGTALATARAMAAARVAQGSGELAPDPTEIEALRGARGGATTAGVHVHSVRLPGLVAHQEVLLGSAGETLTIRHDSTDRVSFMAGVLLAVRGVAGHDGLTVGLEPLL